ncbi:MAG: metalloregulator ArsR/SmtB family transcription factor [Marmoricola sp.]
MDAFEAIADPVRRSLLRSIRSAPARVVDLAAGHPISRPAISKHLRLLVEAGLVTATAHGRERHYALAPGGLAPVTDLLAELAPPPGWRLEPGALDALDTEVRRTTRDRRTGARESTTHHEHEETA